MAVSIRYSAIEDAISPADECELSFFELSFKRRSKSDSSSSRKRIRNFSGTGLKY